MKRIYIAAAILIAVALTESCVKMRLAEAQAPAHGRLLR